MSKQLRELDVVDTRRNKWLTSAPLIYNVSRKCTRTCKYLEVTSFLGVVEGMVKVHFLCVFVYISGYRSFQI